MVWYAVYCAVCLVVLDLARKFPPIIWIGNKWSTFDKLITCSLCAGVWVDTVLAYVMGVNFFDGYFYIVGVSEFLTGCVTSFILFLIKKGFDSEFRDLVITG